jgi:hypothetical protein
MTPGRRGALESVFFAVEPSDLARKERIGRKVAVEPNQQYVGFRVLKG